MEMMPRTLALAFAALGGAISIASSAPDSQTLSPTRIYQVTAPFTNDDGKVATNISGLACMPADMARSTCLVIDDQGRFAQIAFIGNGQVVAGARLPLIGKRPAETTVGLPPAETTCSDGERKFRDLDGEAVAYAAPFFYVVGSHGCSRHSNEFRLSSFILARIPERQVASAAQAFDPSSVETTYRLSEAIAASPQIRQYFTQDLMSANGLNVEGLAIADGTMFAGLRAPTLDGKAFIVAVGADRLFDEKASINEGDVKTISVPMGAGRGIRDLARLNDGQLLILSGPAQDEPVPFEIHVFDIKAETSTLLGTLGELPDVTGAKAEAISVLLQRGTTVDILVMFDGLPSGGARQYTIIIK
jgi:Protein of unknown function (DUF3616)